MKITWRDRVTVMVGEMDRASALDCYKALAGLSELPDGEAKTLEMLTDFCIRLAVEKAPAVVTVDGNVYRDGSVDVAVDDLAPFTITLPLRGAALDRMPYALAEAWQQAAVGENPFLEDWLKKIVGLLTEPATTSAPASDSGPSANSTPEPALPETKTTGS